MPILSENSTGINGTITARAFNTSTNLSVNFNCLSGKKIITGKLQKPIAFFKKKISTCINGAPITETFNIPSSIRSSGVKKAYLNMILQKKTTQSQPIPYTVNIIVNGHTIGGIQHYPCGDYYFEIPPSILNYADIGTASNTITVTTDMQRSYTTMLEEETLVLELDEIDMGVCAANQYEANTIVESKAPGYIGSVGSDGFCVSKLDDLIDPDCIEGQDPDNPLVLNEGYLGSEYF